MRIHGITYPDVNNGLGCRVTLWVSGCIHHCKGCHNTETWDFNSGREFSKEDKEKLFEVLSKPYIKGLTLSGGDPLCSYNDVLELVKEVKSLFPTKDIWLFTGFNFNYVNENFNDILEYLDVIVDGKFVEELKDTSLKFRGSSNQRIIDVKKSLVANRTIVIDRLMEREKID